MVSNNLKGQHFHDNGYYLCKATQQMSYMSRQCVLQHLFFHQYNASNYKTTILLSMPIRYLHNYKTSYANTQKLSLCPIITCWISVMNILWSTYKPTFKSRLNDILLLSILLKPVIFIHLEVRIATAIPTSMWMKIDYFCNRFRQG